MGKDFILAEQTLGYVTSDKSSNTNFQFLVAGSKNVFIDRNKKVNIRSGYKRLGAANAALKNIRNAFTWHTSTGTILPQRFFDDELEVYLRTIDGVDINAWKRVRDTWSTTEKLRVDTFFETVENLDFQLMVNGDDNIYEWNGAVTTIASATSNTITKNTTDNATWALSRFYAASGSTKIVVINGTDYTYTGGETTATLTGVTPDPSSEAANSLAIQKVVTHTNLPEANRNNHTIYGFENQLVIGSEDAEEVFVSDNTYTSNAPTFSFSSPRLSGEGALLTLDDPTRGITSLGKDLLIGSGRSTIFKSKFQQLDVGGTLAETLDIEKLELGIDQGFLNQESILPIGNSIFYLSNEVALRAIEDPNNLTGINPKSFSNPIKPDFDAENWTDAQMEWFKNVIHISAQANSRLYMLNFVEDSDGRLFRYWNPPQTLPVEAMSIFDSGIGVDLSNGDRLHIHSNSVPETYLVFEELSDGLFAGMAMTDKLPINGIAAYAFNVYGKRARLKNFDEYYVEGEINSNTDDLLLTLNYDLGGQTQVIEKTIDGSDEDILEGNVDVNSLTQQSLALNLLGGLLNPPEDAREFNVTFEIAKEDFKKLQTIFSTNDVDRYWAIVAHGGNIELSRRRDTITRK